MGHLDVFEDFCIQMFAQCLQILQASVRRIFEDVCRQIFSDKCLSHVLRCLQINVCRMFKDVCRQMFPGMFADKYLKDVCEDVCREMFEDVHKNVYRKIFVVCLQTNVCRMFEGKLTITTTFISIVAPSY